MLRAAVERTRKDSRRVSIELRSRKRGGHFDRSKCMLAGYAEVVLACNRERILAENVTVGEVIVDELQHVILRKSTQRSEFMCPRTTAM